MTADRDPAVGALLDRLPVPPRPARFWDDLRHRLRTEVPSGSAGPAREPEGADVVELRPLPVPHRPRRDDPRYRRRRVVAATIAAAAVLTGEVVGYRAIDDGDVRLVPAPSVTSPSTTPDRIEEGTPDAAARDGALAWIDTIDRGDGDGAWDLVGPQSRASIGGRAAFDELMASALPEGWGSWPSAEGLTLTPLNLGSAAEPRLWAVLFDGDRRPSGGAAREVAVLLVRVGPDLREVTVEPFVPGPAVGLIELPRGEDPLGPGTAAAGPIEVHVDADVDRFVVAIDGLTAQEAQLERDGPGAVIAARPAQPLSEGPHSVLVAVVFSDGTLAADARLFQVT